MTLAVLVLGLVSAQRGGELLLARRNTTRLLARGAVEIAPGHYPLIVVLHAAWLATLWALGWDAAIRWGWLAAFVALQAMRVWVILSLGGRWTTRIVVMPGAPLARRGPYRWVPHPNYAVVAGEIATLPLALGLPLAALVFSVLNAAVLAVRVRAENAALAAASHGSSSASQ